MTTYQSSEFTTLFETYTGGSSGIGAHLTRLATEADSEAQLLVATATDLILYPGDGGTPSTQGFRIATRGFKELAAVSHLGPAIASLVVGESGRYEADELAGRTVSKEKDL